MRKKRKNTNVCNAVARLLHERGVPMTLRQIFEVATYKDGKLVRLARQGPTTTQSLGQYLIHDDKRRFLKHKHEGKNPNTYTLKEGAELD